MSTHNICFRGEIRKIFTGYPLLSRPMNDTLQMCGMNLYILCMFEETFSLGAAHRYLLILLFLLFYN